MYVCRFIHYALPLCRNLSFRIPVIDTQGGNRIAVRKARESEAHM